MIERYAAQAGYDPALTGPSGQLQCILRRSGSGQSRALFFFFFLATVCRPSFEDISMCGPC